MTILPLYGGPLKRDLIQRAYGVCGQSVSDYELTPEEYTLGLRALDDTIAMLEDQQGVVLGYNYPINGGGEPGEESGIPRGAAQAVTQVLARELAAAIGKQLGAEANGSYAKAMSLLLSTYAVIPTMELGRNTPRGAGSRTYRRTPFFITDVSDAEPVQ